jgi:hypothetical protein
MKRTVALPALAVALMLTVAAAVVVSLSAGVPRASAYVLSNGCDEFDPARGITYRCTPDRSTFYTPDGVDPTRVYVGAGYGTFEAVGDFTINDTLGIPPPAPYKSGKDYCSNPWWAWNPFEGDWQPACYNHDVCYGSQLGRKYCDSTFWRETTSVCRKYWLVDPRRYACLGFAIDWYAAIRAFGAGSYKPRLTSFEP